MRAIAALTAALAVSACSAPFFGDRDAAPRAERAEGPRPLFPIAFELEAGYEPAYDSDFHNGVDIPGALTVEARDFGDTHDAGYRVALRGSTAVNETTEVGVAVSYSAAQSRGPISVGAVGLEPIQAEFGDYKKIGLEANARRYFNVQNSGRLRSPALLPFVTASAGVAHVEAIDATFTSAGFPNLGVSGLGETVETGFYGDSIVPTVFAGVGVNVRVAPTVAIEVETGLRYDGRAEEEDEVLSALQLEDLNNTEGRFSTPVIVRLRAAF